MQILNMTPQLVEVAAYTSWGTAMLCSQAGPCLTAFVTNAQQMYAFDQDCSKIQHTLFEGGIHIHHFCNLPEATNAVVGAA